MTDVDSVLKCIAASGLSGTEGAWPSSPLRGEEWSELIRLVHRERIAGLLGHAISKGSLPTNEEQASQARREHFEGLCSSLFLETGALEVIGQLTAAGVRSRMLKGAAVAHLDYPDPAMRLFADVDLIVPSEQFDQAVHALTSAGHVRRHREPRPGFDRRFSKGASFLAHGRLEIDLHRTFVMGPFGLRIHLEDVWGPGSTFSLGGTQVEALGPEVRFLHACFHTALGNLVPRLVPQRDVAQMLLGGRLDMERVDALLAGWQAEPVVAKAVSHTWRTLHLTDSVPLADWALHYRPSPRSSRELALYSDPDGSYAGKSIGALRAVPGLRDKVAFAYALAVPQRSYLQGRYTKRRERWVKALRAAGRF